MSILRTPGLLNLCAFSITLATQAKPGPDDHPYALKGKHGIELQAGLLSSTRASSTVSVDGMTTSSTANGFLGALAYSYWVENTLAVTVSAGASDASAETTAGTGGSHRRNGRDRPNPFRSEISAAPHDV